MSAMLILLATPCAYAVDDKLQDTPYPILQSQDIFGLEYASDLTVSPDGKTVYFVRHFMDINADKKRGNIWKVDTRTSDLRPLTNGLHNAFSLALSPSGDRLAYVSTESGKPQIYMLWLDTLKSAAISHLPSTPSNLSWSPDGKSLAFSMFIEKPVAPPVSLKGKPKGAEWAEPAKFIDDVYYRSDSGGYSNKGSSELFLLSAQGGTPRQLTNDDYDNGGEVSWSNDGKFIYFSANRHAPEVMKPLDPNIHSLNVESLEIITLTDRVGPDYAPKVSPDGKYIAYLGYDDFKTNYENTQLYLMSIEGQDVRLVSNGLDRSISDFAWSQDGQFILISYDDHGKTVLARQSLIDGDKRTILTDSLGGKSYGRPYTNAEFSLGKSGITAFTYSTPSRPADVAVIHQGKVRVLTELNEDLLANKRLAKIEEIVYKSRADGKEIQGWIAYPPNYEKGKKYPLILEIHGGPVTAYGPHFSMEVQLFAAAGYVVLYTNPRGSSSYGKAFAQTINKNYPSQDYDDLMSGVDTLIEKGIVDANQLYVTGGSGGGVLTAWTVGHTDRFNAAVVAKPVINWYSFVLTADFYPYVYQYWFTKKPWEDSEQYMKHSPISYVGNVKTPTMLLTGENDYRTPISETEQYYQALKIQGVDTAMVRIPGASHGIYKRPSHLMAKVEYILWWFEKYGKKSENKRGK
ncbi:S9 family peptidase [Aestuariibacter sp. AA17]|uniref:S9 family peptidase n=1 Tax=Fluctibacter corallii TaxID=2984329 RepID=A0ABT3A5Z2_9ALTE|nr:S9 family peptidase [Aestuariibacter sp. AA17]MCV2883997.1 S9 family peptidase [Aestuariibacter sp. AA17]